MSYVYPGTTLSHNGVNSIDINSIISNIAAWEDSNGLGVMEASTYKSSNNTAAYFQFMKMDDRNFTNEMIADFVAKSDQPKYRNYRKYMIILANIILASFCDNELVATQIDYKTVCQYDGIHSDLVRAVEKWAKEIDENNSEYLTQISMIKDGKSYPIAFYSSSSLRVFPFNTINASIKKRLIGCDSTGEYTFSQFSKDLSQKSGTASALYAALKMTDQDASMSYFSGINGVNALCQWLLRNFHDDVVNDAEEANAIRIDTLYIAETTDVVHLPICSGPISIRPEEMFSDKLLMIKATADVDSGYFYYKRISNIEIGITDPKAPIMALIPPISDTLMEQICDQDKGIKYKSCKVSMTNNCYHVSLELCIDGTDYKYDRDYSLGDVVKCYNFPLISILKNSGGQYLIHRTDYDCKTRYSGAPINGRDISIGGAAFEGREAQLDRPCSFQNDVFFSVRYNNNGKESNYGYLYMNNDKLDEIMSGSSALSPVIDSANDVAQVARLDAITGAIISSDVYNDVLFFFNSNGRTDCTRWGQLDVDIFSVEGGARYALAPYSEAFTTLVADDPNLTIVKASLTQNGNSWTYQVTFTYNGITMNAPARVYGLRDQKTCPNPPFLHTIPTAHDDIAGYELVLVQNMRVVSESGSEDGNSDSDRVDASDLHFLLDAGAGRTHDLVSDGNYFLPNGENLANVQIWNTIDGKNYYYGRISLPVTEFSRNAGFHALTDGQTKCAAFLLVVPGVSGKNEIISARVFDNDLFLFSTEESRKMNPEYKAWSKTTLLAPVRDDTSTNGKTYEMMTPFSREMIQIIQQRRGDLKIPTPPTCVYNAKEGTFTVTVNISREDGEAPQQFQQTYREDKDVIRCDNMPFILPLQNVNGGISVARFNNEVGAVDSSCEDGSQFKIDVMNLEENYVQIATTKTIGEPLDTVPIGKSSVIKMQINRKGKQYCCHALYAPESYYSDGVHIIQSQRTRAQHILDFSENTAREVSVFTDYRMRTGVEEEKFAGDTNCKISGSGNKRVLQMYSIPITIGFSQLMKERGLSITSCYSNVHYYTDWENKTEDFSEIDRQKYLYVEISLTGVKTGSSVMKKFTQDKILKFDKFALPQLTVFPYVNFIADEDFGPSMAGKSLWHQYTYARFIRASETPDEAAKVRNVAEHQPVGSRVEFWANGKKMSFSPRSTALMNVQPKDQRNNMELAEVDGWGEYIHMKYDGRATTAVNTADD